MENFKVKTDSLTVKLKTGPDIKNITHDLQEIVRLSTIQIGTASVFVVGSTGTVTTIEYEPGVVSDLKRAITSLAPPEMDYAHEEAWHDGNGHSHVQAALLGPSLTVPIRNGKIELGTWQQVVVINHDNGPRNRKIEITIMGIL